MNLRSFRVKLTVATLVSLLAMFGLVFAQTWLLLEDELRSELRNRIDRTNTLLVAAIALPMAQRDYATLAELLAAVVGKATFEYVVIEDHRQRRIAATDWPDVAPLPEESADQQDVSKSTVHVRRPVQLAGQTLGNVQYGISLQFLHEARAKLAVQMVRIGTVGLVVGLALLLPLGFLLSRRLRLLETTAQQLASGDLSKRIHLKGNDELAHLGSAFNHMAENLQSMITDLRRSEERFQHAVQGSSDGIWDWDVEGDEYYFSPRHKEILGYAAHELPEHRALADWEYIHPEDRTRLGDAIRRHFKQDEPFDIEFRAIHRNGHYIWCRSRGQAVRNDQGRVIRFAGATSDITDRKQVEAALQHMAHYDALTQLPNRTLLADRLKMSLAQAQRRQGRIAVCLIDLDGFKPVNDRLGHEVGDRILVEVAHRLRSALRQGDTVARLGGDEFVLVLSGGLDQLDYERALTRLLALLAQPYLHAGERIVLSASIGVTFFPDDVTDPDTLLRHADQAMYVAKQAGRNRWHVFDAAVDRDLQARQEARNRVEAALDAGQLVLHYQPKADLRAGRVIGAEALLRWQDPARGLVPPGEFLPQILNSEFESRLSEWVIDTALAQIERWRSEGLTLSVSVNLPARHLQSDDFPGFLQQALARHPGVAPELLELEVLESAAIDDVEGVSERMQTCRRLGVRFALDDFGTGYGSLAYLRSLPLDVLKIDQSFIRDMLSDPDDLAIVRGVIGLAAAFRATVIAEGVETVEHGVMLLHLGCDLAQGYGIARPMAAEKIPGWVAEWKPPSQFAAASRLELERVDLPLATVEVEHRRWVDRMANAVRTTPGQPVTFPPLDSTACNFGIWLDGDGRTAYSALPEYHVLRDLHEEIHRIGRTLVRLVHERRSDEAHAELATLFAQRDRLIEGLRRLIEAVANQRRAVA
jgi:diguanylate cyclase (GGDEF)-like protein/PAS domain S-box-containing protein